MCCLWLCSREYTLLRLLLDGASKLRRIYTIYEYCTLRTVDIHKNNLQCCNVLYIVARLLSGAYVVPAVSSATTECSHAIALPISTQLYFTAIRMYCLQVVYGS